MTTFPTLTLHLTHFRDLSYFRFPVHDQQRFIAGSPGDLRGMRASVSVAGLPQDDIFTFGLDEEVRSSQTSRRDERSFRSATNAQNKIRLLTPRGKMMDQTPQRCCKYRRFLAVTASATAPLEPVLGLPSSLLRLQQPRCLMMAHP